MLGDVEGVRGASMLFQVQPRRARSLFLQFSPDRKEELEMRLTRFDLACILSGVLWSGIALLIAQGSMGTIVWAGVFASPLIGLVVGRVFRPAYEAPRPIQFLYSLFTLYLAVALFGLAVGFYDTTRPLERDPLEVVLQAVLATLWGVTFTGFVVLLWPLSYLNHRLLCRASHPAPPRGRERAQWML